MEPAEEKMKKELKKAVVTFVATAGMAIIATFTSFAGIASDSNASYEVETEVMDDEDSDNQDNESFETSDKVSGNVEIGDFDLPEKPEIAVEDNTETVIIEKKDEVIDITSETDTDIEVEVDEDIVTEPSVVINEEQEAVTEADDNTVIIYDDTEIQEEESSFETSDKIVGEIEIGDFDLPETPEEPEVVPPTPVEPDQPEEIPSEPEQPEEPETPQEPEEPEVPQEPEQPETPDEPVKPATPSNAEPEEPEGPRGHYSGNDDDDDDITVIRIAEPEPVAYEPEPQPEPIPVPVEPEPVPVPVPENSLPKTGDSSNVLLAVFLVSGVMLITLLVCGNRKDEKSEMRKEICAASDKMTINPAEYARIQKMVLMSVGPICTTMDGNRQIMLQRRLDYLSRKAQGKPNLFIWQLCPVIRGIVPVPLGIFKKRKLE